MENILLLCACSSVFSPEVPLPLSTLSTTPLVTMTGIKKTARATVRPRKGLLSSTATARLKNTTTGT